MNIRRFAIICACFGLACLAGCDDANNTVSGCQPGTSRCSGDKMEVCYGLNWQSVDCPLGCDSATNACAISGNSECSVDMCESNTVVLKCTAGKVSKVTCNPGEKCVSGFGCKSESAPVVTNCDEGEMRCSGSILEKCVSNAWSKEEYCENGCDASTLACIELEGDDVCLIDICKDEQTLTVCAADKKSKQDEPCGEGKKCDMAQNKCVDDTPVVTPDCTEGDFKCSADKHATISCKADGTWDNEVPCGENEVCDENRKKCVPEGGTDVCSDGEINCDVSLAGIQGSVAYYECKNGQWAEGEDYTRCPEGQICSQEDQKCIVNPNPDCGEGEVLCVDEHNYQVCDAKTGFWTTGVGQCDEGTICDKTQKKCIPDPNAKCNDNDIKCSADKAGYYACVDGKWSENVTNCGKNEMCIKDKCTPVVCKPGTTVCDDTSRTPQIYECTEDGQRGNTIDFCGATVGFQCNADKTDCAECKDGDARCTNAGMFQICENGSWADKENCGEAKACSAKADSLGCTCSPEPNALDSKCNDDKSQVLVCQVKMDEKSQLKYVGWETNTDCGAADLCDDKSQKFPFCKCTGSDYSCDGQNLMVCDKGQLTLVEACREDQVCSAAQVGCLCKDGLTRCELDSSIMTRQICKNGKWENDMCGKSYSCIDEGMCAFSSYICDASSPAVCRDNKVMKCVDGVYAASEDCGDKICTEDSKGASCKSGDSCNWLTRGNQRCKGAVVQECEKTGILQQDWIDKENCNDSNKLCQEGSGNKASCSNEKNCEPYTFSCSGDKIMYCLGNELHDFGDCSSIGKTCNNGACVTKD